MSPDPETPATEDHTRDERAGEGAADDREYRRYDPLTGAPRLQDGRDAFEEAGDEVAAATGLDHADPDTGEGDRKR